MLVHVVHSAHACSWALQCDVRHWALSYVARATFCANPTWGSCLCKSEMSAHIVRALKSTRVVLGLLRVIHVMMCSDSL